MEKEEYLYMVLNELINAKISKSNAQVLKEFYQKINTNIDAIKKYDNDIEYANQTVKSLENLVYLPIYEIIKKMSNEKLLKYKNSMLLIEDEKIYNEQNIVKELKEQIKDLKAIIVSSSAEYAKSKKDNSINENVLNEYIAKSEGNLNKIEELSNEIKLHEKQVNELLSKENSLDIKTIEEFRTYLLNVFNLNYIDNELKKYKVTRSDEIVVNLCKDLDILDEVASLIKEYIKIDNAEIKKTIKIPDSFSEYKIKGVSSIKDFLLTKGFDAEFNKKDNEIVLSSPKEVKNITENINSTSCDITENKNKLIQFKLDVNNFSNLSFNCVNKGLVKFVSDLCDTLFLTSGTKKSIDSLYKKYVKLNERRFKTKGSKEKSESIEIQLMHEIKYVLDVYWNVLCENMEDNIYFINNNGKFINCINSITINGIKNNNIVLDKEHFSELGLINMKLLIESVLSKYSEIKNDIHIFNCNLTKLKNEIIELKNSNDKNINIIKNKIDKLYYKISPYDFPILITDYEGLNKIFNDKTIINSIVKMDRKNLISKVRSESVKYRDINNELNEDISVIKKKVLNNK